MLFPSLFPIRPALQPTQQPPAAVNAAANPAGAAGLANNNVAIGDPMLLNVQQPAAAAAVAPAGNLQQPQQPAPNAPVAVAANDVGVAGAGVGAIGADGIAANAPAPTNAATAATPTAAPTVAGVNRTFLQVVADYSYDGAPVPRTAGVLKDVFSLSSALFLSLVPEWNPYGREPFNG
jgi:hypothetical protein